MCYKVKLDFVKTTRMDSEVEAVSPGLTLQGAHTVSSADFPKKQHLDFWPGLEHLTFTTQGGH